jgi:hypothetical protein
VRSDMAKVIVERPRCMCSAYRRPKGEKRRRQRLGVDCGPTREGIRRPWADGAKHFNEHLGPLRRYLDKQVGRPWDKVFSEICTHLSRDSVVQDHVRDHVEEYVETDVVLIDGVACHGASRGRYGSPLHRWRGWGWYVCPRTGLLRRIKARARTVLPVPATEKPPVFFQVSDALQCRLLGGAWHLVTLKPLPTHPMARSSDDRDILLGRCAKGITPAEATRRYGRPVYAVASRRLGRRELPQYPIPSALWG